MNIEILGTLFFAIAVLHTFFVQKILKFAHHFPQGSFLHSFFHLMGEVEIVFGFWGALFLILFALQEGSAPVIAYTESLNITEPLFVFVVMVISSTRPILNFAQIVFEGISSVLGRFLPFPRKFIDLWCVLVLGSLSGSFITEPAAMTLTALLLNSMIQKNEAKMMYFLLAVLLVNVSVGGALTPFAAPPILMVAKTWGWDFSFVISHFGWRSVLTVILNSFVLIALFKVSLFRSLISLKEVRSQQGSKSSKIPWGVSFMHLVFLVFVVLTAHHQNTFLGIFLLFLGFTESTKNHQERLRFKESLLVAFFLAGIVVFGSFQKWWLQPFLENLSAELMYFSSVGLTAVTDNAALTYLGSQVSGLTDLAKYALVAGSITGGGLTIIANAPNAAGVSILSEKFPQGVSPFALLRAALLPTIVAVICFWFL